MKNTIFATFAVAVLLAVGLGCSAISPFGDKSISSSNSGIVTSNKTLEDKAVDTAVGEQKIGIQECDEVMDLLAAEVNNPDDGYIVKAGKAMLVNQIREGIKKSIEENKGDKVAIAKKCTEAKMELAKAKKSREAK